MLRLEAVSAAYDAVPVVRDLSLEIPKGELCCLLGGNGAGKTTTVRAVLGLLPIARGGRIFLDGVRIDGLPTYERVKLGIAIVPEGRRLFPRMTVLENLRLGRYAVDRGRGTDAQLETVIHVFPRIKERLQQIAGTLSGGEQSMVAIARGIMANPKILMMDEPSLGLAPIFVNEFMKAIRTINEQGTTVLLIEQNARKALAIASRGYLLQKGEVVARGSSVELQRNDVIRSAYLHS
jgi:branched-chain amino acid transport system ATP-binding protein